MAMCSASIQGGGWCLQVLVYGFTTEKMAIRSWRGGLSLTLIDDVLITQDNSGFQTALRSDAFFKNNLLKPQLSDVR